MDLQFCAFFRLVKLCSRAPSRGANGCRTTAAIVLEVDPNEASGEKQINNPHVKSEPGILLLLVLCTMRRESGELPIWPNESFELSLDVGGV